MKSIALHFVDSKPAGATGVTFGISWPRGELKDGENMWVEPVRMTPYAGHAATVSLNLIACLALVPRELEEWTGSDASREGIPETPFLTEYRDLNK